MSFTDPSADEAQPIDGQGSEAAGGGSPWEQHLTRFPEGFRDEASSVFKEMEGDFTRKFQDAAQYKQGWEPYEQSGVKNYDPEAVSWMIQFYDAYQNNPQAVVDHIKEYATERGLSFGEAAQQVQQQQQQTDEFGFYGQPDQQQLQSLVDQATGPLKQQLEQLQGHIEQQQQQSAQAEATRYIEGQLKELEGKHGDEFNRDMVERFAAKYVETDPMNAIPNGWRDYQEFRNGLEKSVFQKAANAPAPAATGGPPDTSPQKFTGIHDPAVLSQARQFLENNR